MKKTLISLFFTTFLLLPIGPATAQTYNGPVHYNYSGTGYDIYYYTGTYSTLYSFLGQGTQSNPGGGLPPNLAWALLPWFGNSSATDQFVTAWQTASNRGGGLQYPNPLPSGGTRGPYFTFQNNAGNGEVYSRFWDQGSNAISSLTTDDEEIHNYALVSISQ